MDGWEEPPRRGFAHTHLNFLENTQRHISTSNHKHNRPGGESGNEHQGPTRRPLSPATISCNGTWNMHQCLRNNPKSHVGERFDADGAVGAGVDVHVVISDRY